MKTTLEYENIDRLKELRKRKRHYQKIAKENDDELKCLERSYSLWKYINDPCQKHLREFF